MTTTRYQIKVKRNILIKKCLQYNKTLDIVRSNKVYNGYNLSVAKGIIVKSSKIGKRKVSA